MRSSNQFVMVSIVLLLVAMFGVQAPFAYASSPLPNYNGIYVQAANDGGIAFNLYGNNTYFMLDLGNNGGLNAVHVSLDPTSKYGGSVNSTGQSGVFYVTDTGGRGYEDDVVLMVAVNGTIPDSFKLHVKTSGYNWTPSGVDSAPALANVTYHAGVVDETFGKADLVYGPQNWKPAGGSSAYPIYAGEDLGNASNTFQVMFIDTRAGILGFNYPNGESGSYNSLLTDYGAVKVEYSFEGLESFAAFNVYAWNAASSKGTGLGWTNSILPGQTGGPSGYTVIGVPAAVVVAPVVSFTSNVTMGTAPLTVQFTDTSINSPTGWSWSFGDGNTSSEQSPAHTFNAPGNYTVSLNASNSAGSNISTAAIQVTAPIILPVASFTANVTSGVVPLAVQFNGSSSTDTTGWSWDFGDGNVSSERDPVHTFAVAGNYTVSLNASNSAGSNVSTATISVLAVVPVASFTANVTNGTVPLSVQFNDTSINNPTGWSWDFGDGNTSTEQKPVHTYTQIGTYNVTLTVYGTYGNNTLVKSNYIAVYSPYINKEEWTFETGGISGFSVTNFSEYGSSNTGIIVSISQIAHSGNYSLQCYGSSNYGYAAAPLENVSDANTYLLDYWVWSSNVGYGYTSVGITIVDASGATIAGMGGGDSSITDTDNNLICNRPPTAWVHHIIEWNKNTGIINHSAYDSDGEFLASRQITRTASIGKIPAEIRFYVRGYTVSHTVRYDDVVFTSGSPGGNVPANFRANVTDGVGPLTVRFTDRSSGSPTAWLWDFGDGTSSAEQNPAHTYTATDYYSVKLTAYNNNGSFSYFDKKSNYIKVFIDPVSNFTASTAWGTLPSVVAYTYNAVNFTNNSTNVDSLYWDFGDGTNSTAQNPAHIYQKGNYTASLTVYHMGVNNTSSLSIRVDDVPVVVTSDVAPGTYNTTKTVTLTSNDPNATIYYSVDTTDPRNSSTRLTYTGSITVNNTTTLRYAAFDPAGFWSQLYTSNLSIQVDEVISNLASGTYNTTQTVTLTCNDTNATVYYTVDTTDPRISSTRLTYTGPITINNTTTLRYVAFDSAGFWSKLSLRNYVIGYYPPSNEQWTVFGNNNQHTGRSLSAGPILNNTLWTNTTGGYLSYGSPIVGPDGTIYAGSYDKKLYAFNPNGTSKWAYTTGGYIYGTAAVDATGTIYVGSYDKKLYAFNPDGTMKWNYTTGGYIYGYGGPIIGADGTIYVGSQDKKLYAFNPDGTMKWNYTTGSTIYGSAAIGADGTIYLGSADAKLYALNPDGTLKWNYTTGGAIYGSPTIDKDGTIYVGDYGDYKVYAIYPDGTLKWTYATGSQIYGSAAIGADGTIYIGSRDKNLYALNPDGALKWSYATGNYIYGSPAVGANGLIYVGSYDNSIYALNPDGTLQWKYATGGRIYGSPAISADGTLYVGSYDKKLYAFKSYVPFADFSANNTGDIVPTTVQFTDTSKNYPTAWLWDFGDGNTSTLQNPNHTYYAVGNYSVSLTAINLLGNNTTVKSDYIHVSGYQLPVPGFSANLTSGLAPVTVNFTGNATYRPTSWYWDFGDGTNSTLQNVVHTYGAVGNFTVSLTAYNAIGNGTTTKTDYISVLLPAPSADFFVDHTWGVNNVTVQFTPAPYATSWLWDFGDGNTSTLQYPVHTYNNVGYYNVSLTVANAAGNDTKLRTGFIVVRDGVPVPASSGMNLYVSNDAGVRHDILDLVGTCPYVTNTYYFGMSGGLNPLHISNNPSVSDGQVSVVTNQSGTFYVTFNGGQPTLHEAILMLAVNGTIPDDFSVHINSSGYQWDIPTPGTSNNGTTNNLRYVPGAVNETFYKSDFIYGPQVLKPGNYQIYSGQNTSDANNTFLVMFIDLNAGCGGSIRVDYEFHNLTSYAVFNDYGWWSTSNHGTGVTTTNDASSSGYSVIGIPDTPVANFTSSTANEDFLSPVYFKDTSTNVPQSWLWDFGDGTGSTLQNPVHTYMSPGNYTVSLTVTNILGTNTTVKPGYIVKMNPPAPVSAFTANVTSGISPCLVQFTDQSNGSITSWLWNLGDGTNATVQNPTHWYAPGIYTVNLTVTNSNCSSTLVKTGYINVTSNGRANQFINPGFDTGNFSGWTTTNNPTVSTSYAYTGNYSAYFPYPMDGNPAIAQDIDLTNVSKITWRGYKDANIGGLGWRVYIDGVLVYQGSPYQLNSWEKFSAPISGYTGIHNVQFYYTATAGYGMYMDDVMAVAVPVASFTAVPVTGAAPLVVQFNDTSIGNSTRWQWNFGDGDTSTVRNATHTYSTAGTYTVNLTAANDGGSNTCSMTGYITVTEFPAIAPVASFDANVTSGVAPLTVQFNDTSSNSTTAWSWSFGDGNTSSARNPVYTYAVPGNYTVRLNASNDAGWNVSTIVDYIIVGQLSPSPSPVTSWGTQTLNETFYKSDFVYGAGASKPYIATTLPVVYGHDPAGNENYSVMFVDLGATPFGIDNDTYTGGVRVNYTFTNLTGLAAFNMYGFATHSNNLGNVPGVFMTNDVLPTSSNPSGYYVYGASNMSGTVPSTTPLGQNNITIGVANDDGTRFNMNGNGTYTITFKQANGGLNAIHFTTNNGNMRTDKGQVTFTNDQSGMFYISDTGGSGISDVILMVAVNGTVPDGFSLHLEASRNVTPAGPVARFTASPLSGPAPLSVSFKDQSLNSPASYSWDFGDGNSSTLPNPSHSYGTPGTYKVIMNAASGGNTTTAGTLVTVTQPQASVVSFTLNLKEGWNLVSIPLVNGSLWASQLNGTGVVTVATYNRSTDGFDPYSVARSPLSLDKQITVGNAYFVLCDRDTTLTVYGTVASGYSVNLSSGWNMVGWASLQSSTALDVAGAIPGNQTIARYNVSSGGYDPYAEPLSPVSLSFAMGPGEGYFVLTGTNGTYSWGG